MERLEALLHNYTQDRIKMNAAYGLYKDYSTRVKSYESQFAHALSDLAKPLSKREMDHLKGLIDGAEYIPPADNEAADSEPF